MPTPPLIYQLLILAILLVLLGLTLINLHTLPKLTDQNPQSTIRNPQSSVAILAPARNEEAIIEACLRSLLSQTYPSYEIWLYDDASTDATLSIATRISEQHNSKLKTMPLNEVKGQNSKLHVVAGTADPPPAGWARPTLATSSTSPCASNQTPTTCSSPTQTCATNLWPYLKP